MSPEAPSGLDAVVFDLFHTLVTPEAVNPKAYFRVNRMAEALGLETEEFLRWWVATKGERNRHRSPTVAERIVLHCEELGKRVSIRKVEGALYEGDRFHDEAIRDPPAEVLQTLKLLRERGFRIGILSNTDEHESRMWPGSPLARIVHVAHLSIDTGRVKPEPDAYRGILRSLGNVPAASAAYVGDGESHELKAAKEVGFGKVVFMRGYVRGTGFQTLTNLEAFAKQADVTVDAISDLLSVLER